MDHLNQTPDKGSYDDQTTGQFNGYQMIDYEYEIEDYPEDYYSAANYPDTDFPDDELENVVIEGIDSSGIWGAKLAISELTW